MKDFVISTLDALLTIAILLGVIGGFLVMGNADPFGDFNFGMALLGAAIGFFSSVIFSGGIFTLIRIKELLEEQIYLMKSQQVSRQPVAAVGSPVAVTAPLHRTSTIPASSSSSLRRCRKCNAILNAGGDVCSSCGTPIQ